MKILTKGEEAMQVDLFIYYYSLQANSLDRLQLCFTLNKNTQWHVKPNHPLSL